VRKRAVCLYWPEITGEQVSSRTFPVDLRSGVLEVSAQSSSWVHEMQFRKTRLVDQINQWVDANKVWLGPPPLVTDVRFVLAMREREPLVSRDDARRLHLRRLHRTRRTVPPVLPVASEAERQAITAEVAEIEDAELRALIEQVRTKWIL
jgi:hypothetical protein